MPYSRFYLADLQVHTPADLQQGYGDVGGRDPNPAFAERFMAAHERAGVQVIAVTDHNRVDWYPVLAEAGSRHGVTVFPGLEFSVNGCHLIGVWDCTRRGYALAQQFLGQLFTPGVNPVEDARPLVVTRGQVLELAREVVDHQGLAFAPHATMKANGAFAKGVCSNAVEIAQSEDVTAFDICGDKTADVLKNPKSKFGEAPPRWFISGDTRTFDSIGKRALYLKLGDPPSLEGLRQAFLAPATRVRFPESLRADWDHVRGVQFVTNPSPPRQRLLSLEVTGGFHDGLSVEFGPGLNAIIGGKGTGKSALIETIRFSSEVPAPTDPELVRNRQRNFPANADAVLAFQDPDGDVFEARRSGGSQPAALYHSGKLTGVAVSKRVKVRVFGQRELRELASEPRQMLSFVADYAGPEHATATDSEAAELESLHELDSSMTSTEKALARLQDKQGEQLDLKERLERAKAAGVEALLKESDELQRAARSLTAVFRWPTSVANAVEPLTAVLTKPEVSAASPSRTMIEQLLQAVALAGKAAVGSVTDATNAANRDLAPLETEWKQEYARRSADIERRLADAGITDPKQFAELQRRLAGLDDELTGYADVERRRDELHAKRSAALRRLADNRRTKSRLVDRAARTLSERVGTRVRIAVNPLGDKTVVQTALEHALQGQSVRSEQLAKLAAAADPSTIATTARSGPAALEQLGVNATTAAKVASLSAKALRAIEIADTPDTVLIEINLGKSPNDDWRPIKDISPGQRATALLALALAAGQEPLLIDQPEDDLDNRYIFDEVVQVLARVCETRQVIVATHNANIPILGDAELVIALDATADRGTVLVSGGLEDAAVASVARQILEGGDDAFRARQRRYLAAR